MANIPSRYTDVRSKDERRPTVNELANQKYVLQKINGWKIYHLGAGMEDIVDMESELSKRLQEVGRRLEEAAHGEVGKELGKVQELIKANIQRSKVIQDQVGQKLSFVFICYYVFLLFSLFSDPVPHFSSLPFFFCSLFCVVLSRIHLFIFLLFILTLTFN